MAASKKTDLLNGHIRDLCNLQDYPLFKLEDPFFSEKTDYTVLPIVVTTEGVKWVR